jgi:hypothetical protein
MWWSNQFLSQVCQLYGQDKILSSKIIGGWDIRSRKDDSLSQNEPVLISKLMAIDWSLSFMVIFH